ncbi:4'-phosphopantetheinyl transferase superfamily protein [Paenarthrobacter sp.]|uniref:4'-phosphopantetheinyl transferase family protein n=1 Tax=Paenarthrobacter sp. TaxID=1931993 RepID=UPI0028126746|nr:4'-phosphopantetheinyl transferase superfamily protein [Paenarthrobacter sp.]
MDSPILELRKLDDLLVPDIRVEALGQPALDRADKFTNPADREDFIAGRLVLLNFAASLLDVDPARLVPDYHCPQCGSRQDHGRPGFLLDGVPAPLVLSSSRASGRVLLAAVVHPADGLRLGVDLESVDGVGFGGFDDVALTSNEKRFLASVPESEQTRQRARLWARKEAWLKMTGEGLRHNPAELDVLEISGLRDIARTKLPDELVAALALG